MREQEPSRRIFLGDKREEHHRQRRPQEAETKTTELCTSAKVQRPLVGRGSVGLWVPLQM